MAASYSSALVVWHLQAERLSPGHKYIGSYPCDKDIDIHKKKGKSRTHH